MYCSKWEALKFLKTISEIKVVNVTWGKENRDMTQINITNELEIVIQ